MITNDVSEQARLALSKVYDEVIEVPYIDIKTNPLYSQKQMDKYSSWITSSYTKWNALGLNKYSKVMLIEADIIFLKNNDSLFELNTPAGTFSSAFWTRKSDYSAKKTGDIVDSKEILNGVKHSHALIGSMVLLKPDKSQLTKFIEWLRKHEPYGHTECISGPDEQSISEYYADLGVNFTMIGKEYNAIPWKYSWLEGVTPRVFHYFNVEKPWDMPRGKWTDIEPWWTLAALLVKSAPDLTKWFNQDSLKTPAIKKCAYCESLKKDDAHYLLNPENGHLDCPELSKKDTDHKLNTNKI